MVIRLSLKSLLLSEMIILEILSIYKFYNCVSLV